MVETDNRNRLSRIGRHVKQKKAPAAHVQRRGGSKSRRSVCRGDGDSLHWVSCRLEGGNDLVYQPLIRARLGMLDLEWSKNEVRSCQLPNGIANDRVRQNDGRYHLPSP